jgi:hypothetical protein
MGKMPLCGEKEPIKAQITCVISTITKIFSAQEADFELHLRLNRTANKPILHRKQALFAL